MTQPINQSKHKDQEGLQLVEGTGLFCFRNLLFHMASAIIGVLLEDTGEHVNNIMKDAEDFLKGGDP